MFHSYSFYFHTIWFLIYRTTKWCSVKGDVNGTKSAVSSCSATNTVLAKVSTAYIRMGSFLLLRTCQRMTGEPIIVSESTKHKADSEEDQSNILLAIVYIKVAALCGLWEPDALYLLCEEVYRINNCLLRETNCGFDFNRIDRPVISERFQMDCCVIDYAI